MLPEERTSEGYLPIVLDTTVLSNYALSNAIEWLVQAVKIPVTVHAVRQELENGVKEGYEYLENAITHMELMDSVPNAPRNKISVVNLGGLPRNDAPEAMKKLDRGEAHALYKAWPEGILATDDLDARKLAKKRDVYVTGSVGLLADGVLRDELSTDTANEWLQTWEEAGYRSPVESVTELL